MKICMIGHFILLALITLSLLVPAPPAHGFLDDLQVDALLAITRMKTDFPPPPKRELYRLETLYAEGETLRNMGRESEAADRFMQLLSLARELSPPSSPEVPPRPSDAENGNLPDRSGDQGTPTPFPPAIPRSSWLTGTESAYVPTRPEPLRLISARLGVSSRHLASLNQITPDAIIAPGQEIRYNNLRIVPRQRRDGIVINIPDRTLYLFHNGELARTIPVSVGKGKGRGEQGSAFIFETPTGRFRITAKKRKPEWRVPPSIRAEMASRKRPLPDVIPPGKENPLGEYALVTSIPGILIHGTNSPSSVYGFSSHGCIRVTPWEMERLFSQIPLGTRGEIIYEPFKVLVTDDRRVFLEAHPDVYRKIRDPGRKVQEILADKRATDLVDWEKVRRVLRERKGVAEEVTIPGAELGRRESSESIGS